MIGRAFEKEGWEAHVHSESELRMSFLEAFKWTVSRTYRVRQNSERARLIEEEVRHITDEYEPDLVLSVNGLGLSKSAIRNLARSGTQCALWCYDSVTEYPRILDSAAECERVYVFEPSDISLIERTGADVKHLAMGFDPDIYHPDADSAKDLDLLFVGSVFSYPNRVRLLKRLSKDLSTLSMGLWTNSPPYYSPRNLMKLTSLGSRFSESIHLKTLTHEEINALYNSSRICLNIHHAQCKEGLNPRTYEIAGSGALQLVDYHKQIDYTFVDGEEVLTYTDYEGLLRQIDACLNEPDRMMAISAKAERRARRSHTYQHRVKEILRDFGFQ
ncbi:MAG: glycosyltransferase [Methanobacteriota archaeon]|nr:MAG: glycosyltransferase [Euryarchaeota archaeon]